MRLLLVVWVMMAAGRCDPDAGNSKRRDQVAELAVAMQARCKYQIEYEGVDFTDQALHACHLKVSMPVAGWAGLPTVTCNMRRGASGMTSVRSNE